MHKTTARWFVAILIGASLALVGCDSDSDGGGTDSSRGMVLIPGGSNTGINPLDGGQSYDMVIFPATYSLTVSSFYMDRYEVTKALWDEVYTWAMANGYSFDNAGSGKAANHPVHAVSWYDCVKWCNARSQKEGLPAVYTVNGVVYKTGQSDDVVQTSAAGYRLPTQVEWEYAARGGAVSMLYPWGDNTISHEQANYLNEVGHHPTYAVGDHPFTSPAGVFEAGMNAYGLYDMAGNVWEWCFDWYPGHEGSYRVSRGGSWAMSARRCRVGFLDGFVPGHAGNGEGFRAVLPLSP